ncbi:DNA gyrase subunit A, partial [Candidatus Babeliales bacterium]|nr:DNA gyrase subunit A [Candidatus Babeliales bacterium]
DGQGNWGSVDGDNAAAMRYTEVRMAKIARDMLADIEKETVPFVPNFDESRLEPTLLPARIPSLLVNGSTGIAVGMATSVPPHNMREIVDACIEILNNPDMSEDRLLQLVPAPDFPTGGIICGRAGIVKAYRTGHGRVVVRGVVDVEEDKRRSALIIREIPYQVNKADLITKIADLVKNKVIESISDIRDESDRNGIRVVIEIKRGENAQVTLNQLYKHTALQSSMSIILLALYQNRPILFTLREILDHFLLYRKEIITKRTEFDLAKSRAREHILLGLLLALENIDSVVALIKTAQTTQEAMQLLNQNFKLSEEQSKAILEMRLQRLTGLEQDKIHQEISELHKLITKLELILSDEVVLKKEIAEELEIIKKQYGDERRTKIGPAIDILSEADLIPDEDVVVTLTRKGYIKRVPLSLYAVQHRGGKGKKGMADLTDADDVMEDAYVTQTHDELLFFTNTGRLFSMTVFQVPEGSRTSRGRAIVNVLNLPPEEKVVKLLCTRDMKDKFIVMVTKQGKIKKTDAMSFVKVRSTGIRALNLNEGDELAFCGMSNGNDSIIIATNNGQGIHFKETEVRAMGRQAAGVRGINLRKNDFVVGMVIIHAEGAVLFATSMGYGKRVKVADFRVAHRGGVGVRTIPTGGRNGTVIGLVSITDHSDLLLIDTNGKVIRLSPQEVRTMGRQAKGVRLVRLDAGQNLSALLAFEPHEDEIEEGDATPPASPEGSAQVSPIGEPAAEDLMEEDDMLEEEDFMEEPEEEEELEDEDELDEDEDEDDEEIN